MTNPSDESDDRTTADQHRYFERPVTQRVRTVAEVINRRTGSHMGVESWLPCAQEVIERLDAIADARCLRANGTTCPLHGVQHSREVTTPHVEGSGYCPDGCTWPHDHRFERDGVPWPARAVTPPGSMTGGEG